MIFNRGLVRRFDVRSYVTLAVVLFVFSYVLLPTSKAVNNFFYIFIALPGVIFIFRESLPKERISFLGFLWVAFFVWLFLGWLNVRDFQYFKHCVYVSVFCLLVARFVEYKIFRRVDFLFFVFICFVLYVLLSALFYWWLGAYSPGARVVFLPMRLSGPTYTSILLVALLSLLSVFLIGRSRWVWLLTCFSVVFFCVGYILQSRAGLVGLFLVLVLMLFYFLMRGSQLFVKCVFVFVVMVFCGFLIWLFTSHPVFEHLLARADAGRFELWLAYFETYFECKVWFGCPPEYFSNITIRNGSLRIEHPHNIFFSVLFYHGWIGLLFFLSIVVLTLRRAWLQKNPWGAFLFVSLSMLMFDGSGLINQPNEIWLLVFLPCMLILAEVDQKDKLFY